MKRVILLSLGIALVAFGVVGIFLPLVPTTFPLILAAGLFARSSQRFHRWLLYHRVFGEYIRNYQEHRGMTRRHKITTLSTLWIGIAISLYFARSSAVAIIVLGVVLVGVTIHILVIPIADASLSGAPAPGQGPGYLSAAEEPREGLAD